MLTPRLRRLAAALALLLPATLVIADAAGSIGAAGVIGGQGSAISEMRMPSGSAYSHWPLLKVTPAKVTGRSR